MKAFLIIVIAGLLALVGVAILKLPVLIPEDGVSPVNLSLPQLIKPPSLAEQLADRANGCTEENREKFLAEAGEINDAFQDKFRLAISTSRIGLSTIIGDMQDLARELRQVQADPCGKIAQEHMGKAYDLAIDAMLDFMSQRTEGEEIYGLALTMRDEMGHWGAYRAVFVGTIVVDDFLAFANSKSIPEGNISPELEYVGLFQERKLNCVDTEYLQPIVESVLAATRENFDTLGLSTSDLQVTPVTPTPIPCVP